MNFKILILLLLIKTITFCSTNDDAIMKIYKNRSVFCEYYKTCKVPFRVGRLSECSFKNKTYFVENVNKDLQFWQANKIQFYTAFLNSIQYVGLFQKDSSCVVNDSVFIEPLIKILAENENYAKDALKILSNETSYKLLSTYSENIKAALNQSTLPNLEKIKLLALLDLTNEEKYSLLANDKLPLQIKAKLGDLNACDSLKRQYENATNFERKKRSVNDILYVGGDDLIKFALMHFNDSVYNSNGKCIIESIRFPLITGLRKHFPEERLFNIRMEYYKPFSKFGQFYNGSESEAKVGKYFKEIEEWITGKYNVKPLEKDCIPVLRGWCRM